jgi:hypothetical protein
MTDALRARIEPAPTPEEAAAIVAALETLHREAQHEAPLPETTAGRSRWRLAGLLGHPPRDIGSEDPLWSYTRWEDIT